MSELESQYSANRPGYQVESESESEIESNGIEKVIKEPVIDLTGCRDGSYNYCPPSGGID